MLLFIIDPIILFCDYLLLSLPELKATHTLGADLDLDFPDVLFWVNIDRLLAANFSVLSRRLELHRFPPIAETKLDE